MKLIRTQDNVPYVYPNESRDFQLLCRLYDTVLNGTKGDADLIQYITDTQFCNARLLQLLQTKLGFFTASDITDDELRTVLEAFPTIMKNKGSLKAIKQSLYVFLKIWHLNTDIDIEVINKDPNTPYTIRVGIQSSWRDTTILDELFKYILPTGYLFEYIFYSSVKNSTRIVSAPNAKVLYIEDTVNSQIRHDSYDTDITNRLIGSVAMTEVISADIDDPSHAQISPDGYKVTDATYDFDIQGYFNASDTLFYYTKVTKVVSGTQIIEYQDPMVGIENQTYVDYDTGFRYRYTTSNGYERM